MSNNLQTISDLLNKLSLFELYRINRAIDKKLKDPEKNQEIKKLLNVGQDITYFDPRVNKLVGAIIVKIKLSQVLVKNKDDNQIWTIPFYFINIGDIDTNIRSRNKHVSKESLKIGDQVCFYNNENNEIYGEVIKLNYKTATIIVNGTHARWRVGYKLLYPIFDGESGEESDFNQGFIEGELLEG